MNLKTKKILAKEILILMSSAFLILAVYLMMALISDRNREHNEKIKQNTTTKREKLYSDLINEFDKEEIGTLDQFISSLDSENAADLLYDNIIKSGKLTENEIGDKDSFIVFLKSDFENRLKQTKEVPLDSNLFNYIVILIALITYPLRLVSIVIIWSIKTLKS